MILTYALQAAAIGQIALAIVNFFLPRLMSWEEELARLSRLPREVFHVHAWFVSITLALFGVLTWRFAEDFASGASPLAKWLTTGIGIFWTIRLILQWTYYSASHWRGQGLRMVAHLVLTSIYFGWAAVYLLGGRLT